MVCDKCVLILSHSTLSSIAAVVRFGRHCVVPSGIQERKTCCVDRSCKYGRDSRAVRKDTSAVQGFPGGCWLCKSQACTCTAAWISAGIVLDGIRNTVTLRRHSMCTPWRRWIALSHTNQIARPAWRCDLSRASVALMHSSAEYLLLAADLQR